MSQQWTAIFVRNGTLCRKQMAYFGATLVFPIVKHVDGWAEYDEDQYHCVHANVTNHVAYYREETDAERHNRANSRGEYHIFTEEEIADQAAGVWRE